MKEPLLILCPLLVTPENTGVKQLFHPLAGPTEGGYDVAGSSFVPSSRDPPRTQGVHNVSTHLWAPEQARVM